MVSLSCQCVSVITFIAYYTYWDRLYILKYYLNISLYVGETRIEILCYHCSSICALFMQILHQSKNETSELYNFLLNFLLLLYYKFKIYIVTIKKYIRIMCAHTYIFFLNTHKTKGFITNEIFLFTCFFCHAWLNLCIH